MKEQPNYYAMIPANVRYDKNLSANAKLLYAELTALSNKNGYCHASNQYLAELYDLSKGSISRIISDLSNSGYIKVVINYKTGTKQVESRYIYINQMPVKQTKRKFKPSEYEQWLKTINQLFDTEYHKFNDQQLNVIDTFDIEQVTQAIFTASTIDYYINECNDKRTIFKSVEQVETLLGGK